MGGKRKRKEEKEGRLLLGEVPNLTNERPVYSKYVTPWERTSFFHCEVSFIAYLLPRQLLLITFKENVVSFSFCNSLPE